jgi:hypothetical protein
MAEITVNLLWDNEADVWIATSEDVQGLVLESGSADALIERVKFAITELMKPDGQEINGGTLSVCFKSERHERVRI